MELGYAVAIYVTGSPAESPITVEKDYSFAQIILTLSLDIVFIGFIQGVLISSVFTLKQLEEKGVKKNVHEMTAGKIKNKIKSSPPVKWLSEPVYHIW